MSNLKEEYSAVFLNNIRELSPKIVFDLFERFGSFSAVLDSGIESWEGQSIINSHLKVKLKENWEKYSKQADQDLNFCQKNKIFLHLYNGKNYPELLKNIFSPPIVLYLKGHFPLQPTPFISVVGSRKNSYYAEQVIGTLLEPLVHSGLGVVSGLARGVDRLAHEVTLKLKGFTIGVIGHGFSYVYPPDNLKLMKQMESEGIVMTEFPSHVKPFPGNFPRRNRIISGLSLGTIVIEGTRKSGSLITAKLAAEQGREVFAVPGPIFSKGSEASHYLIKQGAQLVENAEDILISLGFCSAQNQFNKKKENLNSEKYKIWLDILDFIPMTKEELSIRSQTSPSQLIPILFEMEVEQLIKSLPGGFLVKL